MINRRHEELTPFMRVNYQLIRLQARNKIPQDIGWRHVEYAYTDIIKHVKNGGNVGWKLTNSDLVIDIDPRNFIKNDDPVKRLCNDTKLDLKSAPHVYTGSGGHHYYFKKPATIKILDTLKDYAGIEFKTLGRQVVTPGSIHPCGELYYWDDYAPMPDNSPFVSDVLLNLICRKEKYEQSADGGELTPEQLETILNQLDVTQYRDHDRWLSIMMGCHHATKGEGRIEFIAWSIKDSQYINDAVMIGRRWDSLHTDTSTGITFKTLFKEVLDSGGQLPNNEIHNEFNCENQETGLSPELARLAEMNEQHCIVFDGSIKIYTKEYDPTLLRYYYARYSRSDFEIWYLNQEVDLAGIRCTKAMWWLRQRGRRQYRGIVFHPGETIEGHLNLWQGFSVKPVANKWDKFDSFIYEVICNNDTVLYDYCMNWLAYLIQYPGNPAEVALVMRGSKGTGKGTFANTIMDIIKAHSIPVSSPEHFTGRFNKHLRDCVLLFVDEAFWAGDHRSEGVLKRLITEPTLVYEGKGQDAQIGKNCISVMIASNSDWVIPAGLDGERRYAVLDVTTAHVGDRQYWANLRKQLYDENGLSGLFKYLLERNIDHWHPSINVPQTMALADQKLEGLDEIQEWWFARLHEGILPGQRNCWSQPTETPMQILHDHYLAEIGGLNRRSRRSSQIAFGRKLKKLIPGYKNIQTNMQENELIISDNRGRIKVMQCDSLIDCRKAFESNLGIAIDWDVV